MYLNNTKFKLQNNSSDPILPDYDQELQALWRENHEEVRVFTARANNSNTNINYCNCPGNEPGKIKAPSEHLPKCRFRKAKTVDVHLSTKIDDGYSLGLPLN